MSKKVIKLINNERRNCKISSKKACDVRTDDVCTYIDAAECTIYATDICDKDYGVCSVMATDNCGIDYEGCIKNSADYCAIEDTTSCHGTGAQDYT